MDITEKAKQFAIEAHMGQVRKSEPDKPMVMHPIGVANILKEYTYDDEVIAAGFLHDVVEDTQYTIEDIEKNFGQSIAVLVKGASEPDKSLSWEERKLHTINETKTLPLKNKLVICADKIHNLEDLMIKFNKSGNRDFSAFKRGEEQQRWYYTNIYKSLIYNEDANLPIFIRLKNVIDIIFNKKEDLYLKNIIFPDNLEYYEELKRLHAQKQELLKLKAIETLDKPFVIEFSGTPRTGKTTTINNLNDFFKKGGLKTIVIPELTTSDYYKNYLKPLFNKMDIWERNKRIMEETYHQIEEKISANVDIVLIDRSINDRLIWNYRLYKQGIITKEDFSNSLLKYRQLSQKFIDFLVITYANPITSLRRDYNSSLALEPRSFNNLENITELYQCISEIQKELQENVEDSLIIDTTNISTNDTSINIANNVMPLIRRRYINNFKDKIGY